MSGVYSKFPLCILVSAFLALTLFFPIGARADFINDAEKAIDDTQGAFPLNLEQLDHAFRSCEDDDVATCADAVANDPDVQNELEQAGVDPIYVTKAVAIYLDIKNKDYWKLLEDAGELVACAVAEIITSIDICGTIEAVYNDAKAVYDWFASLFGGCSGNACNGVPLGTATDALACPTGMQQVPNLPQCQPGAPLPLPDYCSKYFKNYCDVFPCKTSCSYCPFGQAKLNGTCSFCPGKTTTATQSADKRCWSVGGNNASFPSPDGSTCLTNGGWGQSPTCCKPGQISPAVGQCVLACPAGQIFDTASSTCHACGSGASVAYSEPGKSSLGKCTCPPFGNLKMDQNGNCVATCPVGSTAGTSGKCSPACSPDQVFDQSTNSCHACTQGTVPNIYGGPNSSAGECVSCTEINGGIAQNGKCVCPAGDQAVGPRGQCQKCAANTYSLTPNSTSCAPCPDNQFSVAGGAGCHPVICPAGQHASHHACVSNHIILAPVGGTAQSERSEHLENPCPPLSKWTGQICIGPRGKHFCPQGLTMDGDVCRESRDESANPCPPLSTWTGKICIGPRGKHFCPQGEMMRGDTCVRVN